MCALTVAQIPAAPGEKLQELLPGLTEQGSRPQPSPLPWGKIPTARGGAAVGLPPALSHAGNWDGLGWELQGILHVVLKSRPFGIGLPPAAGL